MLEDGIYSLSPSEALELALYGVSVETDLEAKIRLEGVANV